ncbi:MAG: hypothetical protein KKA31_01630 [Candidatus Margulisbacteria bacterium]|nr:hypothetical protein [Candidatus Margulisiibacteriota bacterium]
MASITRVGNHHGLRPLTKNILFRQVLIINTSNQVKVSYRGLRIFFGVNPDRIHFSALKEGRLKFVAYHDRFELIEMGLDGTENGIGLLRLNHFGYLYNNDSQLRDEKGPIKLQPGAKRYISADILFPEYAKVKRRNHYNHLNYRASIFFGNLEILLPVDPKAHYGIAAIERRVYIIANHREIVFFEQRLAWEDKLIGKIAIDREGFLLKNGRRVESNGVCVSINGKCVKRIINVTDFIEALAVKDLPVTVKTAKGRAYAQYTNLQFNFSYDVNNLYYGDVVAGKLFLRVGCSDRIEVVKKESGAEQVIGTIPIDAEGKITKINGQKVGLNQPSKTYLNIADFIDELGVRDLTMNYYPKRRLAETNIYHIKFTLPTKNDYYYSHDVKAGNIVCRIARTQIQFGLKESGGFRVIGSVRFSSDGRMRVNGQVVEHEGQAVIKGDPRLPTINLKDIIPEFGRIEKTVDPRRREMMQWGVSLRFDLRRTDMYFEDLASNLLKIRFVNGRAELFADRGGLGKEYIGEFAVGQDGYLLTDSGSRYANGAGEVKSGQRRTVALSGLVSGFRFDKKLFRETYRLFARSSYDGKLNLLLNGNYRRRLKIICLFAKQYLSNDQVSDLLMAKVFFVLAKGVDRLARDTTISADLSVAFAEEILLIIATALSHLGLRNSWSGIMYHQEFVNQALTLMRDKAAVKMSEKPISEIEMMRRQLLAG